MGQRDDDPPRRILRLIRWAVTEFEKLENTFPDENNANQLYTDVSSENTTPHSDLADRAERVIDHQAEAVTEIDEKAEHITKLVVLLLGIIISVFQIIPRLEGLELPEPSLAALLSFGFGIILLVLCMIIGLFTYLITRLRIGLHDNVFELFSDPDYATSYDTHVRRMLGAYAHNIRINRKAIIRNSKFLKATIIIFALSIVYLILAGLLYGTEVDTDMESYILIGISVGLLVMSYLMWAQTYVHVDSSKTHELKRR